MFQYFRSCYCSIFSNMPNYYYRKHPEHTGRTNKVYPRSKNEKIGEYKCDKCPKIFQKSSTLAMHRHRTHNPNFKPAQRIKCQQCEKSYKNVTYMKEHVLRDHEKNTPFACEYCQRTFVLKSILKPHLVNTNTRIKCDECHLTFSTRGIMNQHTRNIHEGLKYPCNYCDYQAPQSGTLTRHIKAKHSI